MKSYEEGVVWLANKAFADEVLAESVLEWTVDGYGGARMLAFLTDRDSDDVWGDIQKQYTIILDRHENGDIPVSRR